MQQEGSNKRGGENGIPLVRPEMAGKGGLLGAVLKSPQVLGLPDGKAELARPREKLELADKGNVLEAGTKRARKGVVHPNVLSFAVQSKKESLAIIEEEEGKEEGGGVSGESGSGADTDSVHSEEGESRDPLLAAMVQGQGDMLAQMKEQAAVLASLVRGQRVLEGRVEELDARGPEGLGFGRRVPKTELDDLLEEAKRGVGGRSIYAAVNENRRGKGVWERDIEVRLMKDPVSERSEREVILMATMIDLLEAGRVRQVQELMAKRLLGVLCSEKSGDWGFAEVLSPEGEATLVAPHVLHEVARDVKRLATFNKAKGGGRGKAVGSNQEGMEKKIKAQARELALLNVKLKEATAWGKGKDR